MIYSTECQRCVTYTFQYFTSSGVLLFSQFHHHCVSNCILCATHNSCSATCSIFDCIQDLEYSRVSLSGYYDHSRELHMWPRTLNTANVSAQRNTEPGACIVTPFYCHELEQWVLVNRGWVPRRKMDPSTRPKGQVLVVYSGTYDIGRQPLYTVQCTFIQCMI